MLSLLYYVGGVFVILHGLVHLMGFVAYWPITELKDLPYKTSLLNGKWDIGPKGMRLISLFWLIAGIAFVLSAGAMMTRHPRWFFLMTVTTLFSLILTLTDWAPAFRGAVINAVILIILAVSRLTPF